MNTLTAANCAFVMSIPGLFNAPQLIQGFAADAMFATEAVEMAQTTMGVDGLLSGGFVYAEVPQTVTIQADSPSMSIFSTWAQTQISFASLYVASATIAIPSLSMKYTLTRGFLTKGKLMPDAKKILQPMEYNITWQSVVGKPSSAF